MTKSCYRCKIMIGNLKNTIILSSGEKELHITMEHIRQYLCDVKEAVRNQRYRLDRNTKRQDNINLFLDYVIDEAKVKEIILRLTENDFSEILQNKHKGYEHEQLYVFGKDVVLLERNGTEQTTVSLYIKFYKLDNGFLIVISFHKQKRPLTYYVK